MKRFLSEGEEHVPGDHGLPSKVKNRNSSIAKSKTKDVRNVQNNLQITTDENLIEIPPDVPERSPICLPEYPPPTVSYQNLNKSITEQVGNSLAL